MRQRTYVRMPIYRYSVVEYDPARPWIIVSQRSGLEVELKRIGDFSEWASEHCPKPRYQADLEPGQLGPMFKRS